MARLGKRERLEKRERLIQERKLTLVRKDMERQERLELAKLPQRERNWLVGRTVDLSVANISGKQHTKNLYIGRSPGTGKPERKAMPDRFASAFMAHGHEKLKASIPQDVAYRIVGITPARKVAFIDKLTGERKFGRIKAKPKLEALTDDMTHREVNEYVRQTVEIQKQKDRIAYAEKRAIDPEADYLWR